MRKARLLTLAVMAIGLAFACSTPAPDATVAGIAPDRASFPPVADLLEKRCGTLDCHGSVYRNLRMYGSTGLRLSPGDRPVSKGQTTSDEYDQDYESIIGLEPEIMTEVVSEGGAGPERLTFVRKARGSEAHKGGSLMEAGSPQDQCITSWLANQTNATGCIDATDASF